MRKFRINVNGNSYEVEVEETGFDVIGGGGSGSAAPLAAPKAGSAPAAIPVVSTNSPVTPTAANPQKAAVPAAGAEVITAPMPGKVMSYKVKVGQQVKEGDIILILEAMKMENEIFCSVGGTVQEIRAGEGTAVNPGDVLVVIG